MYNFVCCEQCWAFFLKDRQEDPRIHRRKRMRAQSSLSLFLSPPPQRTAGYRGYREWILLRSSEYLSVNGEERREYPASCSHVRSKLLNDRREKHACMQDLRWEHLGPQVALRSPSTSMYLFTSPPNPAQVLFLGDNVLRRALTPALLTG